MSEKRFQSMRVVDNVACVYDSKTDEVLKINDITNKLNEQCELIEELHNSDHMGWGRAEKFEKELKQKKIYIKRLEYKVQKFKEENEQLRQRELYLESVLESNEILYYDGVADE